MKKRAKKAKALKRARPATRGPARSTEVSGIARPAAELFVKGVLARGEELGRRPRDPTHKIIGKGANGDRKSTRLNSSHTVSSYAVFCLKKKNRSHTCRRW